MNQVGKRLMMLACIAFGISQSPMTIAETASSELHPFSVIVFSGGANWPLWVASDRGFDAARNIKIAITETRDSGEQMSGLVGGKYDLAITAFDNVIAYHEGQGNEAVAAAPVGAVMGGDAGFLTLVARPEYSSLLALRGQQLAVDAPTTGYAFALEETLRRAGLKVGDYQLVSIGGVKLRYDALMAGQTAGTLLMTPFDTMAIAKGLKSLGNVSESLGHYQGAVAAIRTDRGAAEEAKVVAYIGSYLQALQWLYDPNNRREALTIFTAHVPGSSDSAAAAAYSRLLDRQHGLEPRGAFDIAGMKTVLNLRKRYGAAKADFGSLDRYYRTDLLKKAGTTKLP